MNNVTYKTAITKKIKANLAIKLTFMGGAKGENYESQNTHINQFIIH